MCVTVWNCRTERIRESEYNYASLLPSLCFTTLKWLCICVCGHLTFSVRWLRDGSLANRPRRASQQWIWEGDSWPLAGESCQIGTAAYRTSSCPLPSTRLYWVKQCNYPSLEMNKWWITFATQSELLFDERWYASCGMCVESEGWVCNVLLRISFLDFESLVIDAPYSIQQNEILEFPLSNIGICSHGWFTLVWIQFIDQIMQHCI